MLSLVQLFGQENSPIVKFDAKITSVENQGSKLDIVTVTTSINGEITDSTVTQKGRFFYTLDTGFVYKFEFSKGGYTSKHIIVSTVEAPENVKNKKKLKVEVSLFKTKEGLNVEFLKHKPIGIARYNYISRKLEWDVEYTRIMVEKIITATLELYNNTHPDE